VDLRDDEDLDQYLLDCVRIEPLALSEEFVRLPADYAFWNERYRQALEAHLLAEAERERIWAGCYILAVERTQPSGKPATVEYAKAWVEGDADYRKSVAEGISAQAEEKRVRGILEAIRTKRDALTSLGATQRQELEHDPLIRSQEYAKRAGR
jgi:hypothetical protein